MPKIMLGNQKYQISKKNCLDSEQQPTENTKTKEEYIGAQHAFQALEDLKKEEKNLLGDIKRLKEILNQLQLKMSYIAEKRSRFRTDMEQKLSSEQNKINLSNNKLFSIETWGPAWNDGLIFTVMAENHVWAEEIVSQWLNSNGRETHRIDKIRALVSQDIRAVVNVGAKLLDR